MKTFPLTDRIIHKAMELTNPIWGKCRQKRLNNTDFTIISNNCWAGICYEYYGLPKLSPTIGLYFFADDYIRFVENIREYLNTNLEMITAYESKYKDELIARKQQHVPIGRLKDVDIVFLHYKNALDAKKKWHRRLERVNWDNMIYKFSYMNNCKPQHIHQFENICAFRGGQTLCFCSTRIQ